MTENTQLKLEVPSVAGKKVSADFEGGIVISDAGILLLREVERNVGIIRRFTDCIPDNRDQRYIEHHLRELVTQRGHSELGSRM